MKRGQSFDASPRMLYEMAQKHDEWPGEDYEGSSCRGAIKGWKNMGVCSESEWGYVANKPGRLTISRAISARNNPVGAYYRLEANVLDYHSALNEVEAIYVSAQVHAGWFDLKSSSRGIPKIQSNSDSAGGHAFAIVGYNAEGFIVQNSWSETWGNSGYAIWSYEDWQENISDGWVFRLGIPTPTIFGKEAVRSRVTEESHLFKRAPKRHEIAGHFIHFDDGAYHKRGNYWTTSADIQQTAALIKDKSDWYKHILIFVHGGLNSPKASANRIAALKNGFKRNKIYPIHIMYDTGLAEEVKDVILRAYRGANSRAEGFLDWIKNQVTERTDTLIEDAVRKPVTPLWDEMKRDAFLPFDVLKPGTPDGLAALKSIVDKIKDTDIKIHLAGHSTGGVLIGHLLDALDTLKQKNLISSCTLFAPACTIDFYKTHYEKRLSLSGKGVRLPILDIYNLTEKLELSDNVIRAYRKSLLCLVSNALERTRGKPILGMQEYSKNLAEIDGLNLIYSNGRDGISRSTTHGGFDNDVFTMNSLLKRIVNKQPSKPFINSEMRGY